MSRALEIISFGSVIVGLLICYLGYLSIQRWNEPGSTMFGLFVAGWGSLPVLETLLQVVVDSDGVSGFLWVLPIVPWCLFALQYTGQSFSRRTTITLLVPALGLVPWIWSERTGTAVVGFEALGIILFIYYTAVAIACGLLVLWTTIRYGHLSPRRGAWIAFAGVIPPLTMNTYGVLLTRTGEVVLLSVYLIGLGTFCLFVWIALFRYEMFDTTPAAGTLGERAIARETDDLILIADDDGEVILRNETAKKRLSTNNHDRGNENIASSLGVDEETLRTQDTVEIETEDGVRTFDPQVTGLTDQHDREIGTMVSLRDVTEREIRRQRLEVLNRIVRHNLRNQASVIKANTETVTDETNDEQLRSYLDSVITSADQLIDIGQKAKTIQQLLERDETEQTAMTLDSFLHEIRSDSVDRWPAATVTLEQAHEVDIHSDRQILQFVMTNLVENAIKHDTDGHPTVELRTILSEPGEQYPVTIEVADDGPGIPDNEIEVIESGTETPLQHGTGIGLWITNWALREIGGTLTFPESGPQGSTVHVQLPHEPQRAGDST